MKQLIYIYGNLENNLKIKRLLFETDGPHCAYCNHRFTSFFDKGLTLDHVIPRKYGGSNRLFNLVLCCEECNKQKSSKGGTNLKELANFLWQHKRLREMRDILYETIPSRVLNRLPHEVRDSYVNYKFLKKGVG